jgi:hypothetical protein
VEVPASVLPHRVLDPGGDLDDEEFLFMVEAGA